MDNLNTARTNAETAANDANKVATDIPGMMAGLKSNLNSIFTKDNPMFAERQNALQTFLNAPSQTRADLLPSNQPIIAGSHLNFSPTQQEAQVTAARNAALIPLAGLNQSIVGQYGNLNDILQTAGGLFQAQAKAAQDKAANAMDLYRTAISEYNAIHSANNAGGFGDLSSLFGSQTDNTAALQAAYEAKIKAILDIIDKTGGQPSTPAPTELPTSQPLVSNQPNWWDTITGLLGATPRQDQNQLTPFGQSLSRYNFNNIPIQLGIPQPEGLHVGG